MQPSVWSARWTSRSPQLMHGLGARAAPARRFAGAENRGIGAGIIKNGDKRADHSSGLTHARIVQPARSPHQRSTPPRAPIRTGALFLLAALCCDAGIGWACGADGLPWKAIAFEQPARPHAPASRLKGAAPAQTGALFFSRPKFGRAASSRKKQRERQSRPFPAPTAEIRRAFGSPHTTNQQHLKKALSLSLIHI